MQRIQGLCIFQNDSKQSKVETKLFHRLSRNFPTNFSNIFPMKLVRNFSRFPKSQREVPKNLVVTSFIKDIPQGFYVDFRNFITILVMSQRAVLVFEVCAWSMEIYKILIRLQLLIAV